MITTLIVADNEMARAVIKHLVAQTKGIEVVAECASAIEALGFLSIHSVDLLLLDIEMPELGGQELTKLLSLKRTVVIFSTSKKDYASKAYELNVADYVVKPVSLLRFRQAINKAREVIAGRKQEVKRVENKFIFVKDSSVIRKLIIDEIHFLEAMGDYVKVFVGSQFHVVHTSLKILEEKLSPQSFIRVHRSYIVALSKIDTIEDGEIKIIGKSVPVSNLYKKELNRKLNVI